ncbi:winged helix-turn-helix domain-containing protein [Micrococcus sp. TA1]|uniref:winged helix-turn-helix domain-containing protein n=1 Tax=Micrococcus sp. TA1 TaxID=681627 RepID=UPI001619FB68|nr:winged helix-turn-helix domain-containing protein [Micrococcus sp. TA1]MBB5747968.1 hypothetical protein [Micrococcus sp. TA1]
MTTTAQGYAHRLARGARRVAAHDPPGPQPPPARTQARGFVVYVGMDEMAAAAAGTSLKRLAAELRHYVQLVVPGAETTGAVAMAPVGAPGTDLEVVHQILADPTTAPNADPESGPDPAATDRPGIVIDWARRELRLDGEPVNLTDKEFAILHHLMDHRGRAIDRPELLHCLWEPHEQVPDARMVDVHIRRLRTKLNRFAHTVRTVRGQGYRFYEHPDLTVRTTPDYTL